MASVRFINDLNRIFISNVQEGNTALPYGIEVGENNIFDRFIVIDIKEDTEVPIFLKTAFEKYLRDVKSNYYSLVRKDKLSLFVKPTNFIVSLYTSREPILKKTGDSIINYCVQTTFNDRLISFKIVDDSLYYGTKGLIINSDNKTLMLATVKFRIMQDYSHVTSDQRVYLNPSIFINKDLVSKTILSKIVPVFIEDNRTNNTISLLIEDKSDVIQRPIKPYNYNINEDLQSMLRDNLDYIVSDLTVKSEEIGNFF